MIQDIAPHKYYVDYEVGRPDGTETMLIYDDRCILACIRDDEISYPVLDEMKAVMPGIEEKIKFLFRMDDQNYYEVRNRDVPEFNGYEYIDIEVFRRVKPMWLSFAGVTGYQIHKWYTEHRYCGFCATKLKAEGTERAMKCPECGRVIYPTIMPSVIVAVTNGDKLLLTRYQATHSSYRKYALVAGYAEVGESVEETVRREVMEEVGLKVKNITFYKSQPWSFTDTLLLGFFCEVDGDTTITREEAELAEAVWVDKSEIPVDENHISLTNEMMEKFKYSME